DNALNRAVHEMELVVVPFAAWMLANSSVIDMGQLAGDLSARLGTLSPDSVGRQLFGEAVTDGQMFNLFLPSSLRKLFFELEPWTEESLRSQAERLRPTVANLPLEGARTDLGPTTDPFLREWSTIDPLLDTTLVMLSQGRGADIVRK